jgi:hypothetical protein
LAIGSRGLSATLGPILLVGTESDSYSLIKQSAQGQTSSGIEFRAANGAIMIRIGGFQAQLNNRVSGRDWARQAGRYPGAPSVRLGVGIGGATGHLRDRQREQITERPRRNI